MVSSLRDKLLWEARHERKRCLEVAEVAERRRAECRGIDQTSTETNHVTPTTAMQPMQTSTIEPFLTYPAVDATFSTLRQPLALTDTGVLEDEDKEQMEAILALTKMSEVNGASLFKEAHVSQLNKQVECERQQLEKANAQLATALSRKAENTNHQVICLEEELDSKEAALQAAEDNLERRTIELEWALQRIKVLEGGYGCPSMNDSLQCRHLRSELVEMEYNAKLQLDEKDRQISQLLTMLRARGVYLDQDATACGSERSIATTAQSMGQMSLSNFSFVH